MIMYINIYLGIYKPDNPTKSCFEIWHTQVALPVLTCNDSNDSE